MTDQEKIDRVFKEFWVPIIYDMENGRLNLEQLKKELYDYYNIMDSVSKVYMEVTGGKISKPHADPDYVISAFNDYVEDMCRDAEKELCDNCQRDV